MVTRQNGCGALCWTNLNLISHVSVMHCRRQMQNDRPKLLRLVASHHQISTHWISRGDDVPLPTMTASHAQHAFGHLCEYRSKQHTLHIRYDNNTSASTRAAATTAGAGASMTMPAVATTFVSKPKQAKDLLTLLRFTDITIAKLLSYILLLAAAADAAQTEKSEIVCVSCTKTVGLSAAYRALLQLSTVPILSLSLFSGVCVCVVTGDKNRPVYFVGLRRPTMCTIHSQQNTWTRFGKATASFPVSTGIRRQSVTSSSRLHFFLPFFMPPRHSRCTTYVWTPGKYSTN